MPKTIIFDFAGTLIKPNIIEEANELRSSLIDRSIPSSQEHAHPKTLYKANAQFVEKLTGLPATAKISYRKNDGERMMLTGEQVQQQISTTLFQIGAYVVAKKEGHNIFPQGLHEVLEELVGKGHKIVIVSGIREDIISGMLAIAGCDLPFTIRGQPPILGIPNEENLLDLEQVDFVVGDKLSDLEPAKKLGAKTIFVTWGHASGGEEDVADFVVSTPAELKNVLL
ncbi:HAD family hydrolase [Candidatus Woesearchaeota archaeon]|nr:MAG: HAD family hydrolase [Candidatus Woesearchaeota archaeon]